MVQAYQLITDQSFFSQYESNELSPPHSSPRTLFFLQTLLYIEHIINCNKHCDVHPSSNRMKNKFVMKQSQKDENATSIVASPLPKRPAASCKYIQSLPALLLVQHVQGLPVAKPILRHSFSCSLPAPLNSKSLIQWPSFLKAMASASYPGGF